MNTLPIRIAAAVGLAAALLTPLAHAGVLEDKPAVTAQKNGKQVRGYLLRCWQEGKLIVEEQLASLPPTVDLNAAKLKALDADHRAVYVTDTKNATCLIRANLADRARGANW